MPQVPISLFFLSSASAIAQSSATFLNIFPISNSLCFRRWPLVLKRAKVSSILTKAILSWLLSANSLAPSQCLSHVRLLKSQTRGCTSCSPSLESPGSSFLPFLVTFGPVEKSNEFGMDRHTCLMAGIPILRRIVDCFLVIEGSDHGQKLRMGSAYMVLSKVGAIVTYFNQI